MTQHVIHLKNGRLAEDTPRGVVRTIVRDALSDDGGGGILLHFHGGLVSEGSGRATAERLLPVYRAAGAYPVFFVWEAGLIETVRNNLGELAKERFFRLLWSRIASMVERKFKQDEGSRSGQVLPEIHPGDLEDAISNALDQGDPNLLPPDTPTVDGLGVFTDFERATLEEDLAGDFQLVTEIQKISAGLRTKEEMEKEAGDRGPGFLSVGSTTTLMDPEALDRFIERPTPGARGIVSTAKMLKALVAIAARVISRYLKDRDHGLHTTVVEEILREFYVARVGRKVWSLMKGDTRDAFKPNPDHFGGTAFLEELKEQAGDSCPRITLVGHSTGAVFICEFLEKADQVLPAGFKFDVVFLAPAVTCSRFQKAIHDQGHRIRKFRMFTMKDQLETVDTLVPVLFPRSLLYFVSGVVEDEADMPLVGMERYTNPGEYPGEEYPSVEAVRDFLQEPDRVLWSKSDEGPGKVTFATSHGDFDNDKDTLASIDHVLRTDWQ